MIRKRPSKRANLLAEVRRLLEAGRYLETAHAQRQMKARGITRLEVGHILRHGRHEAQKDAFRPEYQTWNYAIRGTTFDEDRELRIVITLTHELAYESILVITAITLLGRQADEKGEGAEELH